MKLVVGASRVTRTTRISSQLGQMSHSDDFARWPHLGLIRPMAGGGHLGPLSYVYGYRGGVGRRRVGQDTTRDDGIKIWARYGRYELVLWRCAAGFVPKSAIWTMGRCGSTEKRPIWRTKTNRDAMRLGDPRWHTKWLGPIRGR